MRIAATITALALSLLAHEGHHHDDKAKALYQKHCFACHQFSSKELAPPPAAIRRFYLERYGSFEKAQEKMRGFLLGEEQALMRPAIKRFGTMPALPLEKKEAETLAHFILEGNFPTPKWLDKHYKEHKKNRELGHSH